MCLNKTSLDCIWVLKAVSCRDEPAAGHQRCPAHMTVALHLKADLPRPWACLGIRATHDLCPLPGPRATTYMHSMTFVGFVTQAKNLTYKKNVTIIIHLMWTYNSIRTLTTAQLIWTIFAVFNAVTLRIDLTQALSIGTFEGGRRASFRNCNDQRDRIISITLNN